jgi:hypothetical protein
VAEYRVSGREGDAADTIRSEGPSHCKADIPDGNEKLSVALHESVSTRMTSPLYRQLMERSESSLRDRGRYLCDPRANN